MKQRILPLIILAAAFFIHCPLGAQVKVGNNPTVINSNAILDIESADKGVLLPRMALTATANASPLTAHVAGMFVYNTATVNDVTPGTYYNNGARWIRASYNEDFSLLYGSGAPTGGCTPGVLYTDTLTGSPTLGQQWTCSGGSWVSYVPPSNTEWYLKGTTNDAGSNKVSAIYRSGNFETRTTDDLRSTKVVADGGIKLFRSASAPQGSTNGYVDFTDDEADSYKFRMAMRTGGAFTEPTLTIQDHGTTRMAIQQSGNVGIGAAVPHSTLQVAGDIRVMASGSYTGDLYRGNASRDGMEIISNTPFPFAAIQRSTQGANLYLTKDIGTGIALNFLIFNRSDNTIGSVSSVAGANVSFNTTSDFRLKENISRTRYNVSDIMQIEVADYNYVNDNDKTRTTGFLAQQLYKIYPEAVTPGGKDPKAEPWMIDYSKLTPLLVKSMQDQQKEIESLKEELQQIKTLLQKQ
jgi:hypothetical protein